MKKTMIERINTIKRTIMRQKNKGEMYQDDLRELVKLAKEIDRNTAEDDSLSPKKVESILFYVNKNE